MRQPEEKRRRPASDKKLPWERPTVTPAGNVADLVRAGREKRSGGHDGDPTNSRRED